MNCPQCNSSCTKNGVNRSGFQRYYCSSCHKSFTDSRLKLGRPAINDRPMTPAERQKRSRANQKAS
jgi:transposase-like protein